MPDPQVPPAPVHARPALADPGGSGTARRILVVDDDRDARESLGLLLELDGHQVAYAADGAEAIRCEREFAPNLVLLDIGLPDLRGEDVARRMRERGTTARIVALSGAPGDGDASPFDARVTKPARVEDLTAYLP
jgi:DNA-binding response OmpR family regulator